MQIPDFIVNQHLKELTHHQTVGLPFACYEAIIKQNMVIFRAITLFIVITNISQLLTVLTKIFESSFTNGDAIGHTVMAILMKRH